MIHSPHGHGLLPIFLTLNSFAMGEAAQRLALAAMAFADIANFCATQQDDVTLTTTVTIAIVRLHAIVGQIIDPFDNLPANLAVFAIFKVTAAAIASNGIQFYGRITHIFFGYIWRYHFFGDFQHQATITVFTLHCLLLSAQLLLMRIVQRRGLYHIVSAKPRHPLEKDHLGERVPTIRARPIGKHPDR